MFSLPQKYSLPLTLSPQVPQERAAIQQLQQLLLQQLARLPSSAAADEQLLQQAAEIAASSSSRGSRSSSSSSSSSSSDFSVPVAAGELPLLDQTRQQQQWRPDPSRHASSTASASQSAVADAVAVAGSPRLQTAVRGRLEQKLLLREAVGLLIMYDEFLAKNFS
jgi:hypothetical protein